MGIYSSDFRAAERLFQRLMQVSGRTGRDELPGEVIVQTGFPENPLYKAVSEQRYEAASEMLLSERRSAGFPPFVHQAVLRVDGLRRQSIDKFLEEAAFLANDFSEKIDVFDPVEAPIAKVASRHRAQLLVQAHSRTALQKFLKIWHRRLNKIETKSIRWALDVDPMEI